MLKNTFQRRALFDKLPLELALCAGPDVTLLLGRLVVTRLLSEAPRRNTS
jgi:hypothetical protein